MLDINIYEPTRALSSLPEPLVILDSKYEPNGEEVKRNVTYQFRYVVHRQYVGFFTPVVFDVSFDYIEHRGEHDKTTLIALNYIAEAFIEGAIFMNHVSTFIVHMLKGQEAGYNRKEELERIVKKVIGTDSIWYSDWETPSLTQQSQRVVVYDLDHFGSMLDPVNTVKQVISLLSKKLGGPRIVKAQIVAGYTQKTL